MDRKNARWLVLAAGLALRSATHAAGAPAPDLWIRQFKFPAGSPQAVDVQIHNAGDARAARNRLRLTVRQINGTPAGRTTEVTVPALDGHGSTWALVDASGILPKGVTLRSTTFHLEVDATFLVRESSEWNNDKWHNLGQASGKGSAASESVRRKPGA